MSLATNARSSTGSARGFDLEAFFPRTIMAQITEVRVTAPETVVEMARARARRPRITADGRLMIVAADHPAHHDARVGANPVAMADRHDYLGRLLRVLVSPEIDGVLTTPDIIEDLLILDALLRRRGAPTLLDRKVLVGTLNNAGLGGAIFELNSPVSAYTPAHIAEFRLDGAKMLLRASLRHAETLPTLMGTAEAVNALAAIGVPIFIEPLPVVPQDGGFAVQKRAELLAQLVGVASALGGTSRYTWLKLPYCEHFEVVAGATSLPILMLGGASREDPIPMLQEFATGMAAGANVRGAMVGRNVLYPGDVDPQLVGRAISRVIHHGATAEQALAFLRAGAAEQEEFFASLR